MTITVYGEKVKFNNNEIVIFNEIGLDIDSEFMELILHWNNIDDFNNIDPSKIHDICIDSIQNYTNIVSLTLSNLKEEVEND